ncbi:MAG: iron ABC transporter permease [Rhodobacteraceae bacterium]|nr:iron ABC transporter permease [Paracoccaceae bacterium]
MNVKVLLLCLLLPGAATAQGFAGLGAEVEGFLPVVRGASLHFPADHGAHDGYRVEWWYLTANMTGPEGQELGLQWTLFRLALAPPDVEQNGWTAPYIWMGHAGLTTAGQHFSAERRARGATGQAGVVAVPFEAWIDEWQMQALGDGIAQLSLSAGGAGFSYDVTLAAQTPLVLHGQAGFSVKSPGGQASYYYSQPRYALTGTVQIGQERIAVTGSGWLDREWSSQPLGADQSGWDWFSLTFDSGAQMMGFVLRGGARFSSGTWITPDGQALPFGDGALSAEPIGPLAPGNPAPTLWHVQLPAHGVDVQVQAVNPNAWMDATPPYWEGPVVVTGSHDGRGYLEMTGYE